MFGTNICHNLFFSNYNIYILNKFLKEFLTKFIIILFVNYN